MANKEYRLAIKIYGEMEKSLPEAARLTKSELRALSKEAVSSSNGIKKFGKNLQSGLKSTEKVFKRVEKIGVSAFKAIAKAGATATGAVLAGAMKVGTKFESQMSTVEAITGASDTDFNKMQKEAKNIGRNSSFTSAEAGKAMEYEGMAGWKTKDILKGTKGITDLAAASGEDLATVSDIVTDALTAFKLKASDSTHFADVMAAAATNSNTNVSKIGESFKYAAPVAGTMGYSAEDTSILLGLMANQGVKESRAGMTVRSLITRMTKPTKESQAAMDELGISLTDKNGKEKSLLQVMKEMRQGFQKMDSSVERSKYAKMLAGATGQTGLLAMVNSSEKDFKKLEKAIYNCDGAAEEMSKIRLDNLEGDAKLFTSALETAGIDIYDEIKAPLRDVVQSATKWVGDFAKWFTNGGFASVKRVVSDTGKAFMDFAGPVLDVGKWLLDHPDVIAGAIVGVGEAIIAYKVVSGVSKLATAVAGLGTAGAAVLGVAGAVAVIGGITTAMKAADKAAAASNLKKHFGDVSLSMDDLDRAARHIVGNGYVSRVEEFLNSREKADGFVDAMNTATDTINRTNWKVEAGIKIDKESLDSYKSSVKDYIKNAQDYISQQGYSVSVAVDLLLGDDGKGIIKENNKWYAGLEKESEDLSKQINKYMKKALKDGLDIDEQETINKMLSQLENITQAVADAQTKAKMDVLKGKYAGVDMTADSFQNLQDDLSKYVKESNEGAEQAYYEALATLEGRRQSGDLKGKKNTKKYNNEKNKLTQGYYDTRVDALLNSYDFMMDKVGEKYGADVEPIAKGLRSALQKAAKEGNGGAALWDVAAEYLDKKGLSKDTKGAIQTLLKKITPTLDELEKIQGQAGSQGITLKQDKKIDQASQKLSEYDAVSADREFYGSTGIGSPEKIAEYTGNVVAGDSQLKAQMKEGAVDWGKEWGENFAKGIKEGTSSIPDDMKKIMNDVKNAVPDDIKLPVTITATTAQTSISEAGASLADAVHSMWKKTAGKGSSSTNEKPKKHASGGIFTKEHLGIVAEAGYPESVIPIRKSERSISLWQRTGALLGQKMPGKNLFQSYAQRIQNAGGGTTGGTGITVGNNPQPVHIQYSPQIIIQGNADKGKVTEALQSGYAEFEKHMKKYQKNKGRISFVNG